MRNSVRSVNSKSISSSSCIICGKMNASVRSHALKYLVSGKRVGKVHIWWFGWKHYGQKSKPISQVGSIQVKTNLCACRQLSSTCHRWRAGPPEDGTFEGLRVTVLWLSPFRWPQYVLQNQTSFGPGFLFPQAAGHRELCMRTQMQIERDRVGRPVPVSTCDICSRSLLVPPEP